MLGERLPIEFQAPASINLYVVSETSLTLFTNRIIVTICGVGRSFKSTVVYEEAFHALPNGMTAIKLGVDSIVIQFSYFDSP